jgi:hypothetical protein
MAAERESGPARLDQAHRWSAPLRPVRMGWQPECGKWSRQDHVRSGDRAYKLVG